MAVTVFIPTALRQFAGGSAEVRLHVLDPGAGMRHGGTVTPESARRLEVSPPQHCVDEIHRQLPAGDHPQRLPPSQELPPRNAAR